MIIHFRTDYYRPSWHGGDTRQALCVKPYFGVVEESAEWAMSPDRADVTCTVCLQSLERGSIPRPAPERKVKPKPLILGQPLEALPRRRNDHLKHCLAVLRATDGWMFP